MQRFNAANNWKTTLDGPVNAGDTSITVVEASGHPTVPFKITVDDEVTEIMEIMNVTAVSINTLTVERAQENTADTDHPDGAEVVNRFTAEVQNNLWDNYEAHKSETITEIVNVKTAHGAKGDGSTDDTQALQDALDAGEGKTIYIPPGNYITEFLEIRDNTYIVGYDATFYLKESVGSSNKSGDGILNIVNVENVYVEGVSFNGQRDHQTETRLHGYHIEASKNVILKNSSVGLNKMDGIYLGGDTSQQNPEAQNANLLFYNVDCHNNTRQGMSIIAVNGIYCYGCTFRDTGGASPECGIDVEPNWAWEHCTNMNFLGCKFTDNNSSGFVAHNGDADRMDGIRIIGCTFTNNSCGFRSDSLETPVTDVVVRDCRFEMGTITVQARSDRPGKFGNISIINNYIFRNGYAIHIPPTSETFIVEGNIIVKDNHLIADGSQNIIQINESQATGMIIDGNYIEQTDNVTDEQHGIYFRPSNAVISNNTIKNVNGHGIYLHGSKTDVRVQGNRIESTGENGIRVWDGHSRIQILDCIISGCSTGINIRESNDEIIVNGCLIYNNTTNVNNDSSDTIFGDNYIEGASGNQLSNKDYVDSYDIGGHYGDNTEWHVRSATLTVAANNSLHKERADYVCSGSFDRDTIEQAIADLPNGGGKIILLEGNYTLGGGITINKSNVTLEGMGKATNLNAQSNPGIYIVGEEEAQIQYIYIKNMYFRRMRASGGSIHVSYANNLYFHDLILWGDPHHRFWNHGNGDAKNVYFVNCEILHGEDDFFHTIPSGANNFNFINCHIHDVSHGIYLITAGRSYYNFRFINCIIENCTSRGIYLREWDGGGQYNFIISGCTIRDTGSHGIDLGSGATNTLIDNCHIYNNGGDGISDGGVDTIVSDNYIEGASGQELTNKDYTDDAVADKATEQYADVFPPGTTANRPGSPSTGGRYFDTDLGKPIWYDGTDWVDATGTIV